MQPKALNFYLKCSSCTIQALGIKLQLYLSVDSSRIRSNATLFFGVYSIELQLTQPVLHIPPHNRPNGSFPFKLRAIHVLTWFSLPVGSHSFPFVSSVSMIFLFFLLLDCIEKCIAQTFNLAKGAFTLQTNMHWLLCLSIDLDLCLCSLASMQTNLAYVLYVVMSPAPPLTCYVNHVASLDGLTWNQCGQCQWPLKYRNSVPTLFLCLSNKQFTVVLTPHDSKLPMFLTCLLTFKDNRLHKSMA